MSSTRDRSAPSAPVVGCVRPFVTPLVWLLVTPAQLVFLDLFVRPLFTAAAILYPGAKERLPVIHSCRDACKAGLRAHGKIVAEEQSVFPSNQRTSAERSTRHPNQRLVLEKDADENTRDSLRNSVIG